MRLNQSDVSIINFYDRDPQGRILLETAYVSILDAGINPQVVRGKKIGVGDFYEKLLKSNFIF